jgi:hypothetical protein
MGMTAGNVAEIPCRCGTGSTLSPGVDRAGRQASPHHAPAVEDRVRLQARRHQLILKFVNANDRAAGCHVNDVAAAIRFLGHLRSPSDHAAAEKYRGPASRD